MAVTELTRTRSITGARLTSADLPVDRADGFVRAQFDLSDADRLNPDVKAEVTVEKTADGIRWEPIGSATIQGPRNPTLAERAEFLSGPSWVRFRAPPEGYRVRTVLSVTGREVEIGARLDTERGARRSAIPVRNSVAYDNDDLVQGSAVTSVTITGLTIGSGAERHLIATASWRITTTVSSVSGSVDGAFTSIASAHVSGGRYIQGFELDAPSSGSQNFTLTFVNSFANQINFWVSSWENVESVSDYTTGSHSSSTNPTITVPNVAAGDVAISAYTHGSDGTSTLASGTVLQNADSAPVSFACGYRTGSGSFSWTEQFSNAGSHIGVRLVEFAAGQTGETSDGFAMSDAFSGQVAAFSGISESVALSDTQSAIASAAAAVVEAFGLADTDGAIAAAQRAISESAALSGQMEAIAVAVAALSEALALGEAWAGTINAGGQVADIAESTALSEVFVAAVQAYAAISDGFSFSDAWSAQAAAIATIDDETTEDGISGVLELSDAIASVAATFAAMSDALALGEVLSAAALAAGSMADSVSLDDAWSAMSAGIGAIAETIELSGTFAGAIGSGGGFIVDDLELDDTVAALVSALASLSDSIDLTAAFSADAVTVAAISFGLALADSFSSVSSADPDPPVTHFVRAVAGIRPIRVAGQDRAIRIKPSRLN